jgi:hypothetical protein
MITVDDSIAGDEQLDKGTAQLSTDNITNQPGSEQCTPEAFPCPSCSRTFPRKRSLSSHKPHCHTQTEKLANSERKKKEVAEASQKKREEVRQRKIDKAKASLLLLTCPHCNTPFKSPRSLASHKGKCVENPINKMSSGASHQQNPKQPSGTTGGSSRHSVILEKTLARNQVLMEDNQKLAAKHAAHVEAQLEISHANLQDSHLTIKDMPAALTKDVMLPIMQSLQNFVPSLVNFPQAQSQVDSWPACTTSSTPPASAWDEATVADFLVATGVDQTALEEMRSCDGETLLHLTENGHAQLQEILGIGAVLAIKIVLKLKPHRCT